MGGVVLVFDVFGNGIHGAGTIQRNGRHDVFKAGGLHAQQHGAHARRFKLEDALGVPPGEQGVDGGVVGLQALKREIGGVAANHVNRLLQQRQRAQAEKVHFEQPQLLQRAHRILRNKQLVGFLERHIVVKRLLGNHHARRMGRAVARHALEALCHVQQVAHGGALLAQLAKLRGNFQCVPQRHAKLRWHQLCHRVNLAVGDVEGASRVADGGARQHGPEGDNLCHMVAPVFFGNVVDDLAAPLEAKVDVDIRHADALRVQKTLKQQVVFEGVDVGNAKAVGDQGACRRASPRPHGNALVLCIPDKIPHDEKIVHKPHLFNGGKLKLHPLPGLRIPFGEAARKSFFHLLEQIVLCQNARLKGKDRQVMTSKLNFHIALFGNQAGVFDGSRVFPEELNHLLPALEIKFLRLKEERALVVHRLAHLHRHEHLLRLRIALVDVVDVVCGHKRDAALFGQPDKERQHLPLLGQRVVLNFNIVVLAKERLVAQGNFLCPLVVAAQQRLGHLPRQTGRQAD